MKLLRDALAGIACVLALVAVGFWYARDPDFRELPIGFSSDSGSSVPASRAAVIRLSWSADGRRLLALSHGEVGPDGPLVLYDISGARLPIDTGDEAPATVALAPDGLRAFVGTWHGKLFEIRLESEETNCLLELPPECGITAVAVSADGTLVAAAASNGRIFVLDVRTGNAPAILAGRGSSLSDLRFSPDGRRLISAVMDGSVEVWDVTRGEREQKLAAHEGPATMALFLPSGREIMTAGLDDTVRIWNIAEGREEWRGYFDCGGILSLALSPDGKTAAWGGFGRKIIAWDLERGRKKFEVATREAAVIDLCFSPDGTSLAAGGREATIRMYDPTGVEQSGTQASLGSHSVPITDGRTLRERDTRSASTPPRAAANLENH